MFKAIRALALGAFLSATAMQAQTSAINGAILGTVTDPSGAPVAGANVTATNLQTSYQQSATTTGEGIYRLNVLPLGEYSVTVEAQGFAPYRQTGIRLNAGAPATIDVTVQVGTVATEISVNAAAPIVDASRTDFGFTLSSNAVQNLPLVSRNPYNFILQQPNVSGRGNTEFGVPRKVNANGFTGRINYQLDGSNNVQSDRAGIRLLPISETWVQEVQAVNNGFAPEYGNTVGTVFNTITRSGTNEFHGEAAYLFRRTPMSARPALLRPTQPTPDVNVDSGFGDVGGRIVRDKLFFFGGYERVKRDLPAVVTVSPATIAQLGLPSNFADAIPFNQDVTFFIGKTDWQLGSNHRLALRYSGHRNNSPYNNSTTGGLFLLDRYFEFVDRSHAGAAQLVSVLSPNAVNELRFQIAYRSQANNRFSATGTGPAITVANVANFGNSVDAGFLYEEAVPEVTENFSLNIGSHSLKIGGSIRSIRDQQVSPTFGLYTFPTIAAYLSAKDGSNPRAYTQYTQWFGEPSIQYNSLFTGLYAQDSWKPRSNVTLTYGLRYDVYRPPSANENSPFAYSQKFRTDKNNFAPRLGIAIGFGKTVVRASGGIFYDPFQTDTYRKAILNNGSPQFFSVDMTPAQAFAPSFPNMFTALPTGAGSGTQSITTVDPNFATLYSGNANVSISRQLTTDMSLTATYLFTRGNRLPVFRNINLVPSGATLADGRPIFSTTQRVYPNFGNILSAESVGQSVYNGLNVMLTKRFSHGFELFGTYTWSHAIDDAPEQNNIDSSNFVLSDPTNRRRDRGNSLSDRRHVFNGNLVFSPTITAGNSVARYLVNNNRVAIMAVMQSGEVFNMGSNRTLNGDTSTLNAFQRPLYIGRNTLRAPRTVEFNARYSRIFPVGESKNFEFIAESTNLFNRTNVTGLNSGATVDPQGNILGYPPLTWTGALDQRLIQLGVRFNF
ncbi:MAG TPA: TonB-dependent receptor [Bryobacteraceae bacterium]|nr:TonB-dependent receptor [Bryobacteraceae bacterium]